MVYEVTGVHPVVQLCDFEPVGSRGSMDAEAVWLQSQALYCYFTKFAVELKFSWELFFLFVCLSLFNPNHLYR